MDEKKLKKKKLKLSITSTKKIEPINYSQGHKKSVVVEKKMYRKK